jgi:hypothetical protein
MEGVGISKLQFLIKKIKFLAVFFPIFGHQNPRPYPDPDSLEMLDPDLQKNKPNLKTRGNTQICTEFKNSRSDVVNCFFHTDQILFKIVNHNVPNKNCKFTATDKQVIVCIRIRPKVPFF